MTFPAYEACGGCAGGPMPGTVALRTVLLDLHPTTTDLGIYSCRTIRGRSVAWSIHACGRAFDLGVPPRSGGRANNPVGDPIVGDLTATADALGVCGIIWDGRRWSARTPGGAPYRGANPHRDHIHIEQTGLAAATLTADAIRHHLAPTMIGWEGLDIGESGDPPVHRRHVAALQAYLQRVGYDIGATGPHRDGVDGIAGDLTRGALARWKADRGLRGGIGRVGPYEIAEVLAGDVTRDEYETHTHHTTGPDA